LVEWAAKIVQAAGKSLWIVADGAYAKRPFLRRAAAAGVVVVNATLPIASALRRARSNAGWSGPKGNGSIPFEEQGIMRDIGRWLKVNGEAIYGTRPWRVYAEGPTKTPRHQTKEKRRGKRAVGLAQAVHGSGHSFHHQGRHALCNCPGLAGRRQAESPLAGRQQRGRHTGEPARIQWQASVGTDHRWRGGRPSGRAPLRVCARSEDHKGVLNPCVPEQRGCHASQSLLPCPMPWPGRCAICAIARSRKLSRPGRSSPRC
jgi:hypothetical protein